VIKREGEVGKAKRLARAIVKRDFFITFGDDYEGPVQAPCQACGDPMQEDDVRMWTHPESAHKIPRSLQGEDTADNIMVMHAICHTWYDGGEDYKHRQDLLRLSEISARTGGVMSLSEKDYASLRAFQDSSK